MKVEDRQTIRKEIKELFQAHKRIDAIYSQYLKRWNLIMNSYCVLEFLQENPDGLEPAQLADMIGAQRQVITMILNDFEKRGFVVRKERKTDHRRKLVQLSKKGKEFANLAIQEVSEMDCIGMLAFSAEERRRLINDTQRFYEAVKGKIG